MMEKMLARLRSFMTTALPKPQNKIVAMVKCFVMLVLVVLLAGLLCRLFFSEAQMIIIWPNLVTIAVFFFFSYLLWQKTEGYLFTEIGFVYLALALIYTISPALKIIRLNGVIPLMFDNLSFAALSPQPYEMSLHFWRHALFVAGVAAGYLLLRGRTDLKPVKETEVQNGYGVVVPLLMAALGLCIILLSVLSAPVQTYVEHYTRYNHLSGFLRYLVTACHVVKTGGYYVLLCLLVTQYHRYRYLLFIGIPTICVYEILFSLGARIVALTFVLAALLFYHLLVRRIGLKLIFTLFVLAAIFFTALGHMRHSDFWKRSNGEAERMEKRKERKQVKVRRLQQEGESKGIPVETKIVASELESVYFTGFHLYHERSRGRLPSRDWQMFFYDFLAVVPFVDHISRHPQYWYASHYFPKAVVPPTTFGVVADSAIWGGEWDLLVRSLLNGMLFALLIRWFLRRQEKWWALVIYVFCVSTCIMVLKYSLFQQLVLLIKSIIPMVLLTALLMSGQKKLFRK